MINKPGIYDHIHIDDYHSNKDWVSASGIKEAKKSLAHYFYYKNKEVEKKSHFDFGNAFEIALMDMMNDTDTFDDEVIIFNEENRPEQDKGITSKKNQEWKKSIFNSDQYVVKKMGYESYETIEKMLESCYRDSTIQQLIKKTDYQKNLFWIDEESGLKCKTRPDVIMLSKNVIVDIKTTKDASPDKFAKDAANYDYPIQAAMQIRGVMETGLMPTVDAYYWLAVEKDEPFNAQIYRFDNSEWSWADDMLQYYINLIAQAEKEKKYPGYTQQADNQFGIISLDLPLFYKQ